MLSVEADQRRVAVVAPVEAAATAPGTLGADVSGTSVPSVSESVASSGLCALGARLQVTSKVFGSPSLSVPTGGSWIGAPEPSRAVRLSVRSPRVIFATPGCVNCSGGVEPVAFSASAPLGGTVYFSIAIGTFSFRPPLAIPGAAITAFAEAPPSSDLASTSPRPFAVSPPGVATALIAKASVF